MNTTLRLPVKLDPGSCACNTDKSVCHCVPDAETSARLFDTMGRAGIAASDARNRGDHAAAAKHMKTFRTARGQLLEGQPHLDHDERADEQKLEELWRRINRLAAKLDGNNDIRSDEERARDALKERYANAWRTR